MTQASSPRSKRAWAWRSLVALLLLMLVGAALRAAPLFSWPICYDEAMTWKTAQASLADMLMWRHHPDHPPISFAIVKAALSLFGTDALWALRLPSFIASVLCIAAAYGLGRVIRSRVCGLLLAGLVAMHPELIEQGAVGRMYSLFTLMMVLTLMGLVIASRRGGSPWWVWALVGLGLGVGCWTHHLALLLVAAAVIGCVVWLVVERWREGEAEAVAARRRRVTGVVTMMVIAAALAGVGLWLSAENIAPKDTGASATAAELRYTLRLVVGRLHEWYGFDLIGGCMLLFALLGFGWMWRENRLLPIVLVALMALTVVALVPLAATRTFGLARYILPLDLAMSIGLSAMLTTPRPKRDWLQPVAALVLVMIVGIDLTSALTTPMPNAFLDGVMVRQIKRENTNNDLVLYYLPQQIVLAEYHRLPGVERSDIDLDSLTAAQVRRLPAVWLMVGQVSPDDAGLIRLTTKLAAAYGQAFDPAELGVARHRSRVWVMQFSREGVAYRFPEMQP